NRDIGDRIDPLDFTDEHRFFDRLAFKSGGEHREVSSLLIVFDLTAAGDAATSSDGLGADTTRRSRHHQPCCQSSSCSRCHDTTTRKTCLLHVCVVSHFEMLLPCD